MIARLHDGVSSNMAEKDVDRVAKLVMKDFPPALSAIRIRGGVTALLRIPSAVFAPRYARCSLRYGCITHCLRQCSRPVDGESNSQAPGVRPSPGLRRTVWGDYSRSRHRRPGAQHPGRLTRSGICYRDHHCCPEFIARLPATSVVHCTGCAGVMFAIGATLLTGVLCSLAPAFAALHTIPMHSLKEGGRTETDASGQRWLRSGLIVAEIAVALVLLTVAGVFSQLPEDAGRGSWISPPSTQ